MGATLTPPPRSVAQRRSALEIANEVRSVRARLKRKIRMLDTSAGATLVAGLLDSPELQSMLLVELLGSIWTWGDCKTDGLLRRLDVSPRKRIGGLSPRQRELIARALIAHADRCRTNQRGEH